MIGFDTKTVIIAMLAIALATFVGFTVVDTSITSIIDDMEEQCQNDIENAYQTGIQNTMTAIFQQVQQEGFARLYLNDDMLLCAAPEEAE